MVLETLEDGKLAGSAGIKTMLVWLLQVSSHNTCLAGKKTKQNTVSHTAIESWAYGCIWIEQAINDNKSEEQNVSCPINRPCITANK